MANEKPQFTTRELTRAQMLASRKGDKELAATLQRVLASRIDRDKALKAYDAAVSKGNVPRQYSIRRQLKAAGLAMPPGKFHPVPTNKVERAAQRRANRKRAAKQTVAAMSPLEQTAVGAVGSLVNTGEGIYQLLGGDTSGLDRKLQPFLNANDQTVSGGLGGIAGDVLGYALLSGGLGAAGKVGGAANKLKTALGIGEKVAPYAREALTSGIYSGIQPAESLEDRGQNALLGAGLGAVGEGVARGLMRAGGRFGNYLLEASPRKAARRADVIVSERASNPKEAVGNIDEASANAIRNSDNAIGEETAAQQANDRGLSRLERAARSSEEGGDLLRSRDLETDTARIGKLNELDLGDVGTKGTKANAIRTKAGNAIDESLEGTRDIEVDPDFGRELLNTLKDIAGGKGKTYTDVARSYAKKALSRWPKTKSGKYKLPTIGDIDAMRVNFKADVNKAANSSDSMARLAQKELSPVEDVFDAVLSESVPGYRKALNGYARAMAPVNVSEAVRPVLKNVARRSGGGGPALKEGDLNAMLKAIDELPKNQSVHVPAKRRIQSVLDSLHREGGVMKSGGKPGRIFDESAASGKERAARIAASTSRYGGLGLAGGSIGALAAYASGQPIYYGALAGGLTGAAGARKLGNLIARNEPNVAEEVLKRVLSPSETRNAIVRNAFRDAANAGRNAGIERNIANVARGTISSTVGPTDVAPPPTITDEQVAAYRASHPDILPNVTDDQIRLLLAYIRSHPNEQPLSLPINGTAVPASEFNP